MQGTNGSFANGGCAGIEVAMRTPKIRIYQGLPFMLAFALGCAVFSVATAKAQTKPAGQKTYENLIYSVKGPDLFRSHCAACHGLNGKGGGPVAPTLNVKPADLTVIAKNNNGKFPEARIRKIISGEEPSLLSHGTREMPIWGPIFHKIEADQDFGDVRLQNLIKYLESIQQK
jgi:mono/diheme cytochrome c family protein